MLKIFCVVVGRAGSAFPVTIDQCMSVGDLKEAIAPKLQYTGTAKDLQLFLANAGDNAWLSSLTEDVKKLKKGEKTAFIESLMHEERELQGESSLKKALAGMLSPSTDEIHVLVVVPYLHESLLLARQASVRHSRTEMLLEQIAASLPDKIDKSYTDGALGQILLDRLKKDGLFFVIPPTDDGEAFWSADIQLQANAIRNEAVFDAFIAPFFSTILQSSGLVFVNSERYQWLSQSTLVTTSTDLKPDGFATHRGMYRAEAVPDDGVSRPNDFRSGVAEEELFDCIILFERKLSITEVALGQVERYIQNLCPEASASAILFDRRSFWLIRSHKSIVVKVQVAMWANKGSKSLFQNFIADNISPWVTRLSLSCQYLGVDVIEGDAFLGRGAHGRVFRVIRQDGKVFALKIVEKCSVGRLYQEERALRIAQQSGLTACPVGKIIETSDGAALLLSPVGKPLPRPTTRHEVLSLFELLRQLHKNGLVHGDPRVSNVILTGKSFSGLIL
ncbi:putative protein kinase [Plasmopara halstedii]